MSAHKQKQREVPIKAATPDRGTGRETGRAKKPSGPGGRLTEKEREDRHAWIENCKKSGKTEAECVAEWERQHS